MKDLIYGFLLYLIDQDSELLGVMATDVPVKDMNEFIKFPLVSIFDRPLRGEQLYFTLWDIR